jgi:molecular chaperone HscC
MVVTDVAPFSLGIDTGTKLDGQIVAGLFTPIIDRGTVLPVSREQSFSTLQDNQRMITFGVYQGEHSLVRDNKKLGELTVKGLKPKPAGQQSVTVRFTYDLNGILEVDATPEATGKTENLLIEGSPGRLTRKEIEEARKAMARLKFHPRDSLPNATVLARADALFVELTGSAREHLALAIAQFRAVLESQDERRIATARAQLASVVNDLRN